MSFTPSKRAVVKSAEQNTRKPLVWPNSASARGQQWPREGTKRIVPRVSNGAESHQGLWLPLLLMLVVLALTACATSTTTYVKPEVPANLTQPCPDLPDIPDRSERSVAEWIVQTITLYYQCAAKHESLVDAVGTH
jgi:hypothetical protein